MEIHLIAAFCNGFGIGYQGKLPWHIPEDLQYFRKITRNHTVVFGRKTYQSMKNAPLKDRFNIVITKHPHLYECQANLVWCDVDSLTLILATLQKTAYQKVFVAGGAEVYRFFLQNYQITNLYITKIDAKLDCDTYFPPFTDFHLIAYGDQDNLDENSGHKYRYLTYRNLKKNGKSSIWKNYDKSSRKNHPEEVYLNLLQDILNNGVNRPDRTGTGTISVFAKQIRFDISDQFPLITTKFVSWRIIIEELLWFLRGDTDSKILEDRNVNIWKANSTREFIENRGLNYREGDVGSMYGFNWRHYGAEYRGCDGNYSGQGLDQFARVIEMLKNEPYSRRILMTTYNPSVLDQGVLEPCHGIILQFFVEEVDGVKWLSGCMTQRSCDTFIGFPINIGSYAALIYIIAKLVDMHPKELIINTNDTHIYNNHIDQVKLQLTRTPYPFPKLIVSDEIKNRSIDKWNTDDFDLVGYLFHKKILAPMAV